MLVFVRVKSMSQVTIGFFSYLPLLKTHSNQEQENSIHHMPYPEIIEELIQWIINYVYV